MMFLKRAGFIKKIFFWMVLITIIGGLLVFNAGCYANTEIEEKLASTRESNVSSDTLTETTEQEFNTLEEAILSESEKDQDESQTDDSESQDYSLAPSFAYPEVEGLHVTGTPVEIDLETYRLNITGMVEKELEFTFNEIKELPSSKIYSVLNCPGFFIDKGNWTGVKILDLLSMAGLQQGAGLVSFIEEGGGYKRSIDLEKIKDKPENYLVAYHFNDEEFPEVHGFPLRIVAKGETGSLWVKWLGEIRVLEQDL